MSDGPETIGLKRNVLGQYGLATNDEIGEVTDFYMREDIARAQLAAKDAEIAELKAQIDASHAVGYRQGAADMCKTKDAEIARLVTDSDKVWREIPDEFKLDPPDGGDVRDYEAIERMAATLARLREALDWYETYDPEAVAAIRKRAALKEDTNG